MCLKCACSSVCVSSVCVSEGTQSVFMVSLCFHVFSFFFPMHMRFHVFEFFMACVHGKSCECVSVFVCVCVCLCVCLFVCPGCGFSCTTRACM